MTRLKIDNDKAYYSTVSKDNIPIDQISKEDLLELLDLAIEEDDFYMDEYDGDKIQNQAHRIIYDNLYKKLLEVRNNRTQFKDEAENLYKEAFAKYSSGDLSID